MQGVFTAEEMRRLDRRAITELGIPGATLMENAGRGAADAIAAALEPPRDNETVAAVAALAADDDDTRTAAGRAERGERGADRFRRAATGVLHEGGARNAQLGDRAPVEPPHLIGGEDAQHGGYFPEGGRNAWTRKSARIAV